MGARDKLNYVVLSGCVVVSALVGAALESWLAFWGTLIVLIGVCSNAGGIRDRPDARSPSAARDRRY